MTTSSDHRCPPAGAGFAPARALLSATALDVSALSPPPRTKDDLLATFCGWMGAEPDPSALVTGGSSPGALLCRAESMAGVLWQ